MVVRATTAHQTYSPYLTGKVSESAADFDIVFVEQLSADRGIVDGWGELYGIEHG